MKQKLLLSLTFCMAFAISSKAQFVPAFSDDQLPLNQPCEVTALDGKIYKGKLKMAMQMNGKLKMFSISLENDEGRKKFDADEVILVKMRPSNMQKIAEVVRSATDVNRFKDIKSIIDCDWIYYEMVTMGKKDKSYLMQRLNPGENNNKLKAYVDPDAKQESSFGMGGMTLSGGKDKSYYLVADGGTRAFLAKKKGYKNQIPEIYTGCPDFMTFMHGDDDWDNFASHVALYNYSCK